MPKRPQLIAAANKLLKGRRFRFRETFAGINLTYTARINIKVSSNT